MNKVGPEAKSEDENNSTELFRAAAEAWWASVLANQAGDFHPVYSRMKARVDSRVLILEGSVASNAELSVVEAEVQRLLTGEIERIDNRLMVKPESEDVAGVLKQVVVAAFRDQSEAELAARTLHQQLTDLNPELLVDESGAVAQASALPPDYLPDVVKMLKAGQAVLIVQADETEAFRLRQFLEEETNSIQVFTTPPSALD